MRAPTWEASPGALAAFLNAATQVYMADLYTFTLSGGAVLRYTSADQAVTVGGNTYAIGPVIKRGNTKLSVGISVDTLSLSLAADASVKVGSTPLLKFIAAGGLDNARVQLDRAFAAAPGSAWVGMLGMFQGRASDTNTSRYEASVTVNSDSELLNVMVPRNVYQPGCSNTLFDGACGVSKAAFANAVVARSGTDAARTQFSTNLFGTTGYADMGIIVCNTGANAGVARTVRWQTGSLLAGQGSVSTLQPWPVAVAVGDTFTVYPGCDKTQAVCKSKFSNLVHFRGQPYVPAPETVL